MTSVRLLLLTGFLLLAGLATPCIQAADKPAPPNIVVFLVDDMGLMDTSLPFLTDAEGNPERHPLNDYFRTPNMERLAARGIRFSQFHGMSVCSPARLSLMTGQNAARHRTTNWIHQGNNNVTPNGPPEWNWQGLQKGDVTLPGVLRQQGYRTIHVGKAHFGPRDHAGVDPMNVGFEINIGGTGAGRPGSYYSEQHFGNKPKGKNGQIDANAVPHLEKYHDTGTFLTEALTLEANAQISRAVAEGQPFFLHFSHYAVHGPFQGDPRFLQNYPHEEAFPKIRDFATLIEGMDKSLGDVLDQLEKLGVAENTFVIFLSDNGSDAPRNNEHGISSSAPLRGKKGTHYEGGTRIPFIAAWAKPNAENPHQQRQPVPQGAVQTQLASVVDLFPTVLAVAQTETPAGHVLDGASLGTLLTGKPDANHSRKFLMHYPHQHRSSYFTAYWEDDWKVIYHYFPSEQSAGGHYQLFHLKKDPAEQQNLAQTEPEKLRHLMQQLSHNLEQYSALYPVDPDTKQPAKPRLP